MLALLVTIASAIAQQPADSSNTADVTCTFADEKGMRVQYDHSEKAEKRGLPMGKPWTPAGKPFLLFLDTGITVGGTPLAVGAYSLFVIPGKTGWTLVVSKDLNAGAKRDPSQDVAKTPMQTGELEGGQNIATVYLAHSGPNQCDVRIVYGKTMAWGEIHEQ